MAEEQRIFAGLDWGNAKVSLALWDAVAGRPRLHPTPQGRTLVSSDVVFRETRKEGRPELDTIFPVPADWKEDGGSWRFHEIKRYLPVYRDAEAAGFALRPVFDFWRRTLPNKEAHLSVSVPLQYRWEDSGVLCQAARDAGFASCNYVNESLAAVLACLPHWHKDSVRWNLLESGRSVWVLDCGYFDLNVSLIHVRRNGGLLDFVLLAGDCLEDLGGYRRAAGPATVANAVQGSVPSLIHTTFDRPWSRGSDWVPQRQNANWVIGAGGGDNLGPALKALGVQLDALLGGPADVFSLVRPEEAVAAGAAVHAASQGGCLAYRINRVSRRTVLGLRTRMPNNRHFVEITTLDGKPPFEFERAFEIPLPIEGEVEVTLAAALPGGDRFTGLHSFLFKPELFSNLKRPLLIVRGRLPNWAEGTVEVLEAHSGSALGKGNFQLP